MTPYGCVALGHEVGMIEVVPNAETIAMISKKAGGGATGVFNDLAFRDFLLAANPSSDDYERARDIFTRSCAGYCVATYIMGITDRHNDNILLVRSGHLVHIDFGHILRNCKTVAGGVINRDVAPFIFTKGFLAIIAGDEGQAKDAFHKFEELCCDLYIIVRKNASLFVNMLNIMIICGLPELQQPSDLEELRKAFKLELDEESARKEFKNLIDEALNSKMTRWNDFFHALAHPDR